jgi:hypothetical protein
MFLLACFKEPGDGCFEARFESLFRCGEKPLTEEPTQAEVQAHEAHGAQVLRLLDVRTGVSILCSSSQICNHLNPPTVTKPVCQALRAKVHKAEATGGEFVYREGVFAHITHNHQNVRVERCNGHSTLLPGPSEPEPPLLTNRSEQRDLHVANISRYHNGMVY